MHRFWYFASLDSMENYHSNLNSKGIISGLSYLKRNSPK